MKETHILYVLLGCVISLHFIGNYTNHLNTSNLQNTITQHEQNITELENKNITCIQNCEEIVKIDDKVIFDLSEMFKKLDKYNQQPELMLLDASVAMSSAERGFEKRNELLTEINTN